MSTTIQVTVLFHFAHQRYASVRSKSRFRRRPYRGFRDVGETGYPKNGLKGEWTAGADISSRIGSRARGCESEGPGEGVWSWGRDRSEGDDWWVRRTLVGSCSKRGSRRAPDPGSEPPKSRDSISLGGPPWKGRMTNLLAGL